MKRLLSILMLVALFVHLGGSLWTIIAFHLNRDYIASTLCVNRFDEMPICSGKCYLDKQIKKANSERSQSPKVEIFEFVFSQSFTTEFEFLLQPEKERTAFFHYLFSNHSGFRNPQFHPPPSA